MTTRLTEKEIANGIKTWKRNFVAWSQSPYGFYVDRTWDEERGIWLENRNGLPVIWTERQRRAFEYLFTFNDKGQLPHSTVYWFDIGKSGKTLFQAAIGQWLGMFYDSRAEVLFGANARDQADFRCFGSMMSSIVLNPYSDFFIDRDNLLTSSVTFKYTLNTARPIPRKAGSQSGTNAIFIGTDEIWDYTGEGAIKHYEEMKQTPTRNFSLLLTTSYPPYIGDPGPANMVLDEFFDKHDRPRKGITQVFPDLPLYVNEFGEAVWWNHEPYPWHLKIEASGLTFLDEQKSKTSGRHNFYLRTWEARRVQDIDAFVPAEAWDACEDLSLQPIWISGEKNVPMCLGVDLAAKRDTSFVVGRSYEPVTSQFILRYHRIFDPKEYEGRDLLTEVKNAIMQLHKEQNVLAVYIDPSQAYLMAEELKSAGVKVVEVEQSKMRVKADTDYRSFIIGKRLRNYPQCGDLREHVINAAVATREDDTLRIDKRKTSMKIDGAVADSMCCLATGEHRDIFDRLSRRRNKPIQAQKPRINPYRMIFMGGK